MSSREKVVGVQKGSNVPVRVVDVIDGDSLIVEDLRTNEEYEVRLCGVDAPEHDQPYGPDATEFLAELSLEQFFSLVVNDPQDRYGRVIGTLYPELFRGNRNSLNHQMVEAGWAYSYTRYVKIPEIQEAERRARQNRYGVWQSAEQVRPWTYRRKKREEERIRERASRRVSTTPIRQPQSVVGRAKTSERTEISIGKVVRYLGHVWGLLKGKLGLVSLLRHGFAYPTGRDENHDARGEDDRAIADRKAVGDSTRTVRIAYYKRRVSQNKSSPTPEIRGRDQTNDNYTATSNRNIDDAVACYNRGRAYADKGENDRAIAEYDAALCLNSGLPVVYKERGRAYAYKGEWDRAIDDYDTAIRLNPRYPEAYKSRADAYSAKGDLNLAIASYSESLSLNPDDAETYDKRGYVYFRQGDYSQAIADYRQALQLDSSHKFARYGLSAAYYSRGTEYFDEGNYGLAVSDYAEALKIKPDSESSRYGRGLAYFCLGDYDRAIEDYGEAIRLHDPFDPEPSYIYFARGNAYYQKGEYERAIADYDDALWATALIFAPDCAIVYNNRGNAHLEKGEYHRAIADFSQAIALKPDYAAAYKHRGISYFDIGDRDNAQADFEMARSLGYEP